MDLSKKNLKYYQIIERKYTEDHVYELASRKDLKQYTHCKSHKEKDGKRLITNFTLSKL